MDMDMDMANIAMTKLLKLKDELKEGSKPYFCQIFRSIYLDGMAFLNQNYQIYI
jgi:hypothetical protein